jgi:acetyl esterase/lipase
VLVDVHGGAWAYLDRNFDAYFDRALAACGVVVVALPIWIAHPEHDRTLTLAMTEDLVAAYRTAGGQAELEVFPDVGHSFATFPGPAADRCIERMRAFCAGVLGCVPWR